MLYVRFVAIFSRVISKDARRNNFLPIRRDYAEKNDRHKGHIGRIDFFFVSFVFFVAFFLDL